MKFGTKDRIVIFGIVAIILITLLSVSYGFLSITKTGKSHKVIIGNFDVEFKDGETIKLENTYPMTDDEGMNTGSYDFTIENIGNVDASYNIKLEDDKTIKPKDRLNETQIKYSIKIEEYEWSAPKLLSTLSSGQVLVENQKINAGSNKVNYSLKLWVDGNVGNEGQNKAYSAKLVLESIQGNLDTNQLPNTTSPLIVLNGDYSINVAQGSTFTDPGVKEVKDDKDTLSTEDVQKSYEYYNGDTTISTTSVDTSKLGIYYITYKIKDNDNEEGVVVRSVNVYKKDTTPPTIKLNGEEIVELEQGSEYIEEGATAEDKEEGELTDRIVISGTVNTNMPGNYIIRYIVTDNEGNTSSVTRTVIVESIRVVTATFIKSSGIESIEEESISCEILSGEEDCEITLPKITSLPGYEEGFFTIDESKTSGERQGTTVRINSNTNYYAKALDIIIPVCSIYNATTKNAKESDTVEVKINCTDTSGVIGKDLEASSLETLIDGKTVNNLTKTKTKTEDIENGKRYTFNISGFSNLGLLTLNIPANSLTDGEGNGNEATSITTEVIITREHKVTVVKGDGVSKVGDSDSLQLTCNMSKDSDTCTVTLPSITPVDNTFEGYWATSSGAQTGITPGSAEATLTLTKDETYYALVKKYIKVTYRAGTGVGSVSKTNDTCTRYGNNANCSVTLPASSTIIVAEGYNEPAYWNEVSTATTGTNPGTEVHLSDSKTYYAVAEDKTIPICRQVSVTPPTGDVKTSESVVVTINCTDLGSGMNKDLTATDVNVQIGGVTQTKIGKFVSEGESISNGKQYKLTLSDFETTGVLSAIISANAVTDKSGNGNVATSLTLGHNIKLASGVANIVSKANASGKKYSDSGVDTAEMFDTGYGYRYLGASPNNYVTFNGETWRIIGVFSDPDSNGDTSPKMKIMRDASIGNIAWNTSNKNIWTESTSLKNNSSFTAVASGSDKDKVMNMKWYLGGPGISYTSASTIDYYTAERNGTVYSGNPTTATGTVGLIYLSDYGFTFKDVNSTCYSIPYYCNTAIPTSSWMFPSSHSSWNEWTISQYSDSLNGLFCVNGFGTVTCSGTIASISAVRPVIYLNSNVQIDKGSGTKESPYTLT